MDGRGARDVKQGQLEYRLGAFHRQDQLPRVVRRPSDYEHLGEQLHGADESQQDVDEVDQGVLEVELLLAQQRQQLGELSGARGSGRRGGEQLADCGDGHEIVQQREQTEDGVL